MVPIEDGFSVVETLHQRSAREDEEKQEQRSGEILRREEELTRTVDKFAGRVKQTQPDLKADDIDIIYYGRETAGNYSNISAVEVTVRRDGNESVYLYPLAIAGKRGSADGPFKESGDSDVFTFLADGTLHESRHIDGQGRQRKLTVHSVSIPVVVDGKSKRFPILQGVDQDPTVSGEDNDWIIENKGYKLSDGTEFVIKEVVIDTKDDEKFPADLEALKRTLDTKQVLITGDPVPARVN